MCKKWPSVSGCRLVQWVGWVQENTGLMGVQIAPFLGVNMGWPLKPMGNLRHCCAGMREAIQLPLGVTNGDGTMMGVLDGGLNPPRDRDNFGGFDALRLLWGFH